MEYLTAYVEAADALPVLVMPAGVDPMESMETAEAFADAGAIYLLATRLDAARRFGGVLAAADALVCRGSVGVGEALRVGCGGSEGLHEVGVGCRQQVAVLARAE